MEGLIGKSSVDVLFSIVMVDFRGSKIMSHTQLSKDLANSCIILPRFNKLQEHKFDTFIVFLSLGGKQDHDPLHDCWKLVNERDTPTKGIQLIESFEMEPPSIGEPGVYSSWIIIFPVTQIL